MVVAHEVFRLQLSTKSCLLWSTGLPTYGTSSRELRFLALDEGLVSV